VEGGEVSISAEVKREKETKEGDKVLRTERYYGSVARLHAAHGRRFGQGRCEVR